MSEYDWRTMARAMGAGDRAADDAGVLDGHEPGAGRELFAVAVLGEGAIDGGWLVMASGPEAAVSIVHGTVPRAHECARAELMVWAASYNRSRYLFGGDFPATWTVLAEAAP